MSLEGDGKPHRWKITITPTRYMLRYVRMTCNEIKPRGCRRWLNWLLFVYFGNNGITRFVKLFAFIR